MHVEDIILKTRKEAEEVLSILLDKQIDYGQATVADYFKAVKFKNNSENDKWGWTDLRDVKISPAHSVGYRLNLPDPILLDGRS